MATSSLRRLLRSADADLLRAGMPRTSSRRVRERLVRKETPSRASRGLVWGVGLAAAAAATVVLVWLNLQGRPSPVFPDHESVASVAQAAPAEWELSAGEAFTFDHAGRPARMMASVTARLRAEPEGIRIVAGAVEISVRKGLEAAATRFLVSAGAIEVIGTRFSVTQDPDGGSVALHEGAIRFVSQDGRELLLSPGCALRWPLSEGPLRCERDNLKAERPPQAFTTNPPRARPSTRLPAASSPAPSAPQQVDAMALLDRVARLRSLGRFESAAEEIESALAHGLGGPLREQLSYELGVLLTDRLGDPGACSHWIRHSREFTAGRFLREAEAARVRAGCPPAN
ncbi:MAG: hypothetical protein HY901_30520 [Deltaproteobacteria bacterium]|nr:hypothetical protein [Deltaproteobacteria bacterium]